MALTSQCTRDAYSIPCRPKSSDAFWRSPAHSSCSWSRPRHGGLSTGGAGGAWPPSNTGPKTRDIGVAKNSTASSPSSVETIQAGPRSQAGTSTMCVLVTGARPFGPCSSTTPRPRRGHGRHIIVAASGRRTTRPRRGLPCRHCRYAGILTVLPPRSAFALRRAHKPCNPSSAAPASEPASNPATTSSSTGRG